MAESGDETLECKDCGAEFIFSVEEQEFFASKGFDNKPVRCKACKQAKKDRMDGGQGRGDGPPCYAFQRGECDRGSSCRFSHSSGGGGGRGGGRGGDRAGGRGDRSGGRGGGRFGDRDGGRGGGGGGVCYAYQKGDCHRGGDCRFKHE